MFGSIEGSLIVGLHWHLYVATTFQTWIQDASQTAPSPSKPCHANITTKLSLPRSMCTPCIHIKMSCNGSCRSKPFVGQRRGLLLFIVPDKCCITCGSIVYKPKSVGINALPFHNFVQHFCDWKTSPLSTSNCHYPVVVFNTWVLWLKEYINAKK